MTKRSAGLLMYKWQANQLQALLVHPGGPFWAKKDKGAWSIPKGEYGDDEESLDVAKREFREETGFVANGPFVELGTIKQSGGKVVTAWAVAGDCDPSQLVSNTFQMEWPPHSGRLTEFPEVDRARWFSVPDAREHILKSQQPLLEMLCVALKVNEASCE